MGVSLTSLLPGHEFITSFGAISEPGTPSLKKSPSVCVVAVGCCWFDIATKKKLFET